MATEFSFNSKNIIIPGSYSTIKSGQKNPPLDLDYGTVLIIDTGSGAGYGGGSGISGVHSSGKDSIYQLNDIQEMQNFVKGGLWYLLANPLFRPAGLGVNGVSRVLYTKAATTVPASLIYTFTGDGDGSESVVNGGTFTLRVRDEGLIGNGVLTNSVLTKGYAVLMEAGIVDTDKFVLKFYRGTYTGLDQNNTPFDNITLANSQPLLLITSPEFNDMQDLIDWMNLDAVFGSFFELQSSSVNGDGAVDNYDLLNNLNYVLFAGGTETYTTANLTKVLDAVADLQISFIFADDFGNDAQSANNFKILTHIVEDSKYKPELYIAAGSTINNFTLSQQTTVFYDNDHVTVVHGGVYKANRNMASGFKTYDSYYKAAAILGREAGLEPQVPITFKNIDIDGEVHPLNDKEVITALRAGLVVSRNENGSFDIIKGINTLQQNTFLLNDDGTTHSKQIRRIARQLNKEIIINSKEQLLKKPDGVNRNTLSELDVQQWVKGYLTRKIAEPNIDNLILSFREVVVVRDQDAYRITYKFVVNSEISFLFFTGLVVDIN